ncbi:type II secretion system secretin GspD [Nitratifractor sp.]
MKFNKIAAAFLMWGMLLWAQGGADDTIRLNIRNMEVQKFVETIGKLTGKNVLINGELRGKINFIGNRPIKRSALFSLANSILASKGYALIDHGDFMEVVKASEAASMGLPVDTDVNGETMKTVLFPLKNSNAAIIRAKIRPLLTRNAKVVSFKENNVLAVTAYPKTLRSIKKLIDAIENAGHKGSMVIKLKHAGVKDVYANAVSMAKQLFPQTIPSEKVGVFKDESSNSIILVGKKQNVEKMAKYIHQLDREGESVSQKLYVIPLRNSNVEDMEKILSQLVSQMNNLAIHNSRAKGKNTRPSKAMVVADKERNALIVLANGEQYRNIMQVIRRIDVEKPQVYIRARVVEINSKMAREMGAKYGFEGGAITANGLFTMSGNFGGTSSLQISQNLLSFISSQSTDSNGTTTTQRPFSFGNVKALFSLGVQLNLYQQLGAAHVLSEPSILCTNNEESELFVGETRSILTSSASGNNKDDLVRNNWEREDIGLTLKVKPRLSNHDKVALTINAIIEDVDDSSGYNSPTPTTYKRKVTTNAIVRNGQTVILGGLIKNITGKVNNKIPILGDIPIIGRLFQDEGKANRKVELVIYLTPYIVRHSRDLTRLRKFLAELDGISKRYADFIREKKGIPSRAQSHSAQEGARSGVRPVRRNGTHRGNRALDLLRSHP